MIIAYHTLKCQKNDECWENNVKKFSALEFTVHVLPRELYNGEI